MLKDSLIKIQHTATGNKIFLNGETLTPKDIQLAIQNNSQISISEEIEDKIEASAQLLKKFIDKNRIIYGVNTSMGGFVNWLIPGKYANKMQENLISAVATNVGAFLNDDIVKASIIVRLNSLAKGVSAISLENFNKLLEIYNAGIIPCIPCKGSLGASGDLGPLACIALVATGKWKAKYNGEIVSGAKALEKAGIEPMLLSYKEGLSLINGTSVMTGFASLLIEKSMELIKAYELISCLSFEGLSVKIKPFHPTVHKQKRHPGQLETATTIWNILKNSKMVVDEDQIEKELQKHQTDKPSSTTLPIEDAYSIRCTPHIIGPIKENLESIRNTITREINSASDNPLIIPEANDFFHNGHFHGQYISMAMDQLSISLTTLSNLSDRRIDRFMDKNNNNNLPPFLCAENPGLRLGLMGGQFMSTSVNAENRSLCSPISIQTLTSTGDFQDIVSLGLLATRRAQEIYNNTLYVISFELLCAAQAADIRGKNKLSPSTKKLFSLVREEVPYLSQDNFLTDYLEKIKELLENRAFSNIIHKL
ncbi:MAG: Tyrosine ammonia-lyase [Chlamydiae bacterium]|nr:Tyrosine ammonia-lyase [Chlamydiota bacterium]